MKALLSCIALALATATFSTAHAAPAIGTVKHPSKMSAAVPHVGRAKKASPSEAPAPAQHRAKKKKMSTKSRVRAHRRAAQGGIKKSSKKVAKAGNAKRSRIARTGRAKTARRSTRRPQNQPVA